MVDVVEGYDDLENLTRGELRATETLVGKVTAARCSSEQPRQRPHLHKRRPNAG
jgi:hypothetical protein